MQCQGSVPPNAPLHRQTRSGRSFATWDGPHVTMQAPAFNIEARLQDAIVLERARCSGEAVEYDSDTLTPLPSPDGSPTIHPCLPSSAAQDDESIPPLYLTHHDHTIAFRDASQAHSSTAIPTISPPMEQIAAYKGDKLLELVSPDRDDDEPGSQLSAKERRRKRERDISHSQRQAKRAKKKAESYGGGHVAHPNLQAKHIQPAQPIRVSFPLREARVASTGFVGLDDGERSKKVYRMEELVKKGFKVVAWDGITPTPIIVNQQFVGLLAGRPRSDPLWNDRMAQAADKLESARQQCHATPDEKKHRRGAFTALRSGVSHGGGQRRPGNLRNNPVNAEILDRLSVADEFKRLAGFASSVMCHWTPALYRYYVDRLGALFKYYPSLKRNFSTSVFTANTFNLGPRTVCFKHADFANLPFGLCAITALGRFDPKKGGHFVIWDFKLIIEFPPGSTILILSAILAHFNLPISPRETRYSFTQYSAGGLFRWVENGFQKSTDFWASLSPEAREQEEKKESNRWLLGLSLLPILETHGGPLSSA